MKVLCGYRKCGLGCAVVRAEPDTLTLAARRSVLGLSAYATKIGRSLVPANSGLKIYFWDTSPNLHTALARKHRGVEIWQGYLGSLTEPMNQVFPPDQTITPQCRSLFNNFFGVKLP